MTNINTIGTATKTPDNLDRILEIEREVAAVSPKFAKLYKKFEQEKAALLPELINYYNGDIERAARVAEDMAYGLVYNN